jgi:hypothetical protein
VSFQEEANQTPYNPHRQLKRSTAKSNNAVTFRGWLEFREKRRMCYILGKSSHNMKTIKSFGLVLIAGVLCFASAKQVTAGQSQDSPSRDPIYANSLADGGSIRLKHSPVLGINIPITVWIDGELAGAFTKGHVFQRHLAPGRHTLYAARPRNAFDSYYGTLDVRRGETLSFVVKCTPNRVILQPVDRVD